MGHTTGVSVLTTVLMLLAGGVSSRTPRASLAPSDSGSGRASPIANVLAEIDPATRSDALFLINQTYLPIV